MAYTFLKAQGKGIGKSLLDESKLDYCVEMMKKAEEKGVQLLLQLEGGDGAAGGLGLVQVGGGGDDTLAHASCGDDTVFVHGGNGSIAGGPDDGVIADVPGLDGGGQLDRVENVHAHIHKVVQQAHYTAAGMEEGSAISAQRILHTDAMAQREGYHRFYSLLLL